MIRNILITLSAFLIMGFVSSHPANAFYGPQNLAWECTGPITLAGAKIWNVDGGFSSPDHQPGSCVCYIPPFLVHTGVTLNYWSPSHMVEVVKTPWYFPFLDMYSSLSGFNFSSMMGGSQGGGAPGSGGVQDQMVFYDAHYIYYPLMAILEIFQDAFCSPVKGMSMDLLWVSEVDPIWNDEAATAYLFPETYLMANPFASLPCIVQSIAASLKHPIEPLFWCWGGTTIYPMTGNVNDERLPDANYEVAARTVFYQNRLLLHLDKALDPCWPVPTPIWLMNHYKYQPGMPVNRKKCMPPGYSSILRPGSNPPFQGTTGPADEFLWTLWTKENCCFGVTL